MYFLLHISIHASFLLFFKFYSYKKLKLSIKDFLLLIYTFMCMIIFIRIIILSFQSHQNCILNAGLGMAWSRYGLSCNKALLYVDKSTHFALCRFIDSFAELFFIINALCMYIIHTCDPLPSIDLTINSCFSFKVAWFLSRRSQVAMSQGPTAAYPILKVGTKGEFLLWIYFST